MKQSVYLLIILIAFSSMGLVLDLDSRDGKDAIPSALLKAVNQAYELNMKGLAALEKKEYDAAMAFFDEALAVLPDYSDAENNRGVVFFRRGTISSAKNVWEELVKKDPGYYIAMYNLGLIYLHESKIEAASRMFERVIKVNKQFVEAYVRLGRILLDQGKNEKALELLRRAYKLNPDHDDTWSSLAFGLLLARDTLEAVNLLKKHEDKPTALSMLGQIEIARKKYAIAAGHLSKAVSKGAAPSVLVNLASAQLENGQCKEALSTLEKYFSLSIQHEADSWLQAGIAAKECKNVQLALEYFEQGVKRFPQDAILRYNLGQIYFHQKKFEAAEEVWEGLSDTVQDPSLFFLRALNARKKNKLDKAEQFVKKALSIDERAEYYDLLGVLKHQQGDDKSAQEQFKKALKIDPQLRSAQLNSALLSRSADDLKATAVLYQNQLAKCSQDSCAEIAFQLSIIYYHQKMYDKAAVLLASVKDSEKDERIYRHLAVYYRELHDWEKAITTLESAIKLLIVEPQTKYDLAETYLMAGYHSKAAELLLTLLPEWRQNPWRLFFQVGYAYLELNDFSKAKEYFEKSIASKDNVAARGLLAFVYHRQGKITEARSLWAKNLKDDPSNPALWINMGLSHERDGKYDQALEHYLKALQLRPDDKELQINLGNAYAGVGRDIDAFHAFTQALSSGKREIAAYNMFLLAQKRKEKDRAEKMAKLLNSEFPSSVNTKRVQVDMSLWNGDTSGAISIMEKIVLKEPADWLILSKIFASKGDLEKARNYLKKIPDDGLWIKEKREIETLLAFQSKNYGEALRLLETSGDTSFTTQYNIALAAYNAGKFSDALIRAERLVKKVSGNDRADVCRLAGNAAFALKQWQKAKQWYLQLSTVEASNSIVQYNLAVASYNVGELENAWKYYTRARELDPTIKNIDIEKRYSSKSQKSDSSVQFDSTDIWYNLAVEFHNDGKDTAAEELYLKVVRKDPQYSLAWNNLGAIYGARGMIDDAEKAYKKAIEKRYNIPEVYANLVNLYIELEEFTKARQWVIKGLGHNPENEILSGLREKIGLAEQEAKKRSR